MQDKQINLHCNLGNFSEPSSPMIKLK